MFMLHQKEVFPVVSGNPNIAEQRLQLRANQIFKKNSFANTVLA